jgi:ATP-binding cassette subfamily C protein
MRNVLTFVYKFMSRKERIHLSTMLALKSLVGLLDLAGILLIGFLTASIALLISQKNDPSSVIEIGPIAIPAISQGSLPVYAAIILILFLSKSALSVLLTRSLAFFLAKVEARAARVIAKNAFGNGLEGARQNSREEILFAVQGGSPSAFNTIPNAVGNLLSEAFLFFIVLVTFAVLDPFVALATVLYFGFTALLIQVVIGFRLQKASQGATRCTIEANTGLSDLGEVLRETSILGTRDFFYDNIFKSRLNAAGYNASHVVLTSLPRHIIESSLIVAIAALVVFQSLNASFETTAATLAIFLTGGLRLTASLLPLQSALLSIRQSIPYAQTAFNLLREPKDANSVEISRKQEEPSLEGPAPLSIKQMNFTYVGSSRVTLENISLDVRPGSQIAFIGTSGAGKSTLADIVLGLLVPSSGEVKVYGKDPSRLIAGHPGLLGYVPQKPGMISGTIAQNIALGVHASEVDHKRLDLAVNDSHLRGLIDSLPLGINTEIGKRKDELSGGQIQRIGLARALYTQPRLLVMDEATSALDAESENEINKALDGMRGKVTVLLIAHRLNTVQRSDRVYLLEDGKIAGSGTFSELLDQSSKVRRLAELMSLENVEVTKKGGS